MKGDADGNTAVSRTPAARFSGALLKVSSRCNLDCDYCYVYHHVDQSWRKQPPLMSDAVLALFSQRLSTYIAETGLRKFSIIFHGGEPLLYGAKRLATATDVIRGSAPTHCSLDFSVQTNGVLLTDEALSYLVQAQVSVSLSLDGPRSANDLHRLDHRARSTFDATFAALERLQSAPAGTFAGVIAVIDPLVAPRDLFEFFAARNLPRLDLLLPDATHAAPPTARRQSPEIYSQWLEEAFRIWFNEYPAVPLRWFDAVLASRFGVPSATDVMGLGEVSLIVIETDGSYSDHDVFKVAADGAAHLGSSLRETSLTAIAHHERLREHAKRLCLPNLPAECRVCPVVEACGGGSIVHRFHPLRGLDAPSVYCGELFHLFEQVSCGLSTVLSTNHAPWPEPTSQLVPHGSELYRKCYSWRLTTEARADRQSLASGVARGAASPAAILLDAGSTRTDAQPLLTQPAALWLDAVRVQLLDRRLSRPFESTIRPLQPNSEGVTHVLACLPKVASFLSRVDRDLPASIAALISDILVVETTVPGEVGIVSFSANTVPLVIYVASHANGQLIEPADLGDSIYHEFLHHVLYQIDQEGPLLIDPEFPRFPAPWRQGLRPSSGFLHGTFVFAHLASYWAAVACMATDAGEAALATSSSDHCARQAAYGVSALRQFGLLTSRGRALLDALTERHGLSVSRLTPPGKHASIDESVQESTTKTTSASTTASNS